MDWGSFAGGVGQGLEQGQQMRARQIAMQDQLRHQAAHQAASNVLQSLVAAGPDAGATSPTAVPPQPTPAVPPGGPPGAQPMPPAGPAPMAGPAPGGPPQAVPMPGAQLMPQAAAPPPAPAPLPAGPPQGGPGGAAPPGPAGPAVSGPAAGSTGDVWVDSKKTLQSAARWVAQANPGRKWKPGELLDAVNEVIETMNGLNPMEKIAAQAQIAGAKAQHDWYTAETQRLSEQERETKDKTAHSDRLTALDAAAKRVKMQSDTKLKAVAAQDLMRMQVAELAQAGQDERQGKLLDFRQQALDAGLDEKTWQTLVQAGLKEQGMSDAFAGRVFSAQARSAGQATAPPTRQRVGAAPPPPKRGAAPTAGPKVDPVKEKAEALSHIRAGADPAQVRDIYKQRTGQPADF